MTDRIRLIKVNPKKIEVPPVRITSAWDPEEYQAFQDSIEADGIATPIICVKEGDTFWLSDGLHRLQEALLKGHKRIDVAYKEGTLVDAMTRNLYLNRLRGKTKATEEVKLIKFLQEEKGLSLEEIQKRTGLSERRLEHRLQLARADPAVLEALDHEQVKVGVAYQLSRLPTEQSQVRLLAELLKLIPPPRESWVKEVVDGAIDLIKKAAEAREEERPLIPIRTLSCRLCEQRYEVKEMRGINVCETCLGITKKYVQDLKRRQKETPSPEEALMKRILEPSTGGAPEP